MIDILETWPEIFVKFLVNIKDFNDFFFTEIFYEKLNKKKQMPMPIPCSPSFNVNFYNMISYNVMFFLHI